MEHSPPASRRPRFRWRLLLATLVISGLTVGLAACGEDETMSRDEYESAMREINQDGYDQLNDLAPSEQLPDQELLESIRDELNRSADKLDKLNPPADIAEAHSMWVDGLRAAADTIDDIEDELTDEDRSIQLRAYQKLGESLASRRLEDAREAYVNAGYDVFGAPGNAATTAE